MSDGAASDTSATMGTTKEIYDGANHMHADTTTANPAHRTAGDRCRALALLAGLALLGGCANANLAQSGTARFGSNVPFERITRNGWLEYKANIIGVREGTVSDNIRRVAIDVYSDQANTQRFSYRFEWFDAGGMPVSAPASTFTSVVMQPKQTVTLTSVAPSPAATDWRVTFLDEKH